MDITINNHKEKFIEKITKNITENNDKINNYLLSNNDDLSSFDITNMRLSIINIDDKIINEILLAFNKMKKRLRLKDIMPENNHVAKTRNENNTKYRTQNQKIFNINDYNTEPNKNNYYIFNLEYFQAESITKNKKNIQKIINNLPINVLSINTNENFRGIFNNLPCKLQKIIFECCDYSAQIKYLPNSVENIISNDASGKIIFSFNNSLINIDFSGYFPCVGNFISLNPKLPIYLKRVHFYSEKSFIKPSLFKTKNIKIIGGYDESIHDGPIFYPELVNKHKYDYNHERFFYELKN
jgi:hypothetical protein